MGSMTGWRAIAAQVLSLTCSADRDAWLLTTDQKLEKRCSWVHGLCTWGCHGLCKGQDHLMSQV